MPRAKVVGKKRNTTSKSSQNTMQSTSKANKKSAPAEGGMKTKRRFRPGTVALREIKRYQKQTTNILPRAPV